jgi:glycosyltransferase involved in cell wall biosynthesis
VKVFRPVVSGSLAEEPGIAACFLGGARYAQPLDSTDKKKFRALNSLGAFFVVGFSRDLKPRRFTEYAHFYLLPGLPLPLLRYAEMFTFGLCLVLWLIIRYGVRVLIAQSPYEGFAAALAKTIAGWLGYQVWLIVESHGDFEVSLFLQRYVRLQTLYRFLMRHTARFALRGADLLRAVSRATREQLEQWAPGKSLYQFPAWTDIEVFLQAGSTAEERVAQNILYTGVLIPRKGVHHLISAFACIAQDFSQARLVIVGHAANKRYAAGLKAQVRQRGLDARVQFIGELSQTALAAWMRRASMFVLPSTSEGLGRVVIEAMAARLPVVGSNVGGIPDMVENGVTGFLIPPGDESALAAQLSWMLAHPETMREMGSRAQAFAEQFFSTAAYVRNYKQMLETAQARLAQ